MCSRLAVLCLGFTFLAARQTSAQPPPIVTGGVRAGVLLSDVPNLGDAFGELGSEIDRRYTFIFGGQVTLRLTDNLALQPEVFYASKGLRGERSNGREFQVRLTYVDVPLLLRVHRSNRQGLYGFAGPSVNVNVSANIYTIGDGVPLPFGDGTSEPFSVDIKNLVRTFEGGFVVGAGIQMGMIAVEGRFIEGLTNVFKNPEDGESARNRSIAILAGVPFP